MATQRSQTRSQQSLAPSTLVACLGVGDAGRHGRFLWNPLETPPALPTSTSVCVVVIPRSKRYPLDMPTRRRTLMRPRATRDHGVTCARLPSGASTVARSYWLRGSARRFALSPTRSVARWRPRRNDYTARLQTWSPKLEELNPPPTSCPWLQAHSISLHHSPVCRLSKHQVSLGDSATESGSQVGEQWTHGDQFIRGTAKSESNHIPTGDNICQPRKR